jgi:hypothetical protein
MDQSTTSILHWPWPLSALARRKAPARAVEPPPGAPPPYVPEHHRKRPLWIIDFMEGTVWREPPG